MSWKAECLHQLHGQGHDEFRSPYWCLEQRWDSLTEGRASRAFLDALVHLQAHPVLFGFGYESVAGKEVQGKQAQEMTKEVPIVTPSLSHCCFHQKEALAAWKEVDDVSSEQ